MEEGRTADHLESKADNTTEATRIMVTAMDKSSHLTEVPGAMQLTGFQRVTLLLGQARTEWEHRCRNTRWLL